MALRPCFSFDCSRKSNCICNDNTCEQAQNCTCLKVMGKCNVCTNKDACAYLAKQRSIIPGFTL